MDARALVETYLEMLAEHWGELDLMEVFQPVDVLPQVGGAEAARS
jgi:hypothetical protein